MLVRREWGEDTHSGGGGTSDGGAGRSFFVLNFLLSACQAEVATGWGAVAPGAKQAAVVIDTLKISTWLSPAGVGDPAWGRAELLPLQPLRLPDVSRAGHAAHAHP